MVFCEGSCRGGPGNLHMKVYAFSRTGLAQDVIITGSANMTDRAVSLQWNDLYTMNNETALYNTFLHIFNQLTRDRAVSTRWVTFREGDISGQFYKNGETTRRRPAASAPGRSPSCQVPTATPCSSG